MSQENNNGCQLKNPDISGAIFTLSLSIPILNSQCVGASDMSGFFNWLPLKFIWYISYIVEILSYFYNDNVCFIMELTKGNSVNKQLIFIRQFESKLLFSNTCLLSKLKSFRLKHTNGYIITHWKIIHDVTCKWIPFNMAFVT